MDNTILIDVQVAGIEVVGNSFEEVFLDFLNFVGQKEGLSPLVGVNYPVIKSKIKGQLKGVTDPQARWEGILREFLGKGAPVGSLAKSLSAHKTEWLASTARTGGVRIDEALHPSVLQGIERYGKVLLFVPTNNPIEAAFYQLFASDVIAGRKIHTYGSPEIVAAVKSTPSRNLFVVSVRPRKLRQKMLTENQTNGPFDIRTNFIFLASPSLDNDTMLYYDSQLAEMGIIWDIISLKVLASRLLILISLREQWLDPSKIIVVQIYNLPDYLRRGIRHNLFQEAYPVTFSYTHPLSKRPQRFPNTVWYVNWNRLVSTYKVLGLPQVQQYLEGLQFSSKAGYEVMPRDMVRYYGSRKLMQDKLNEIAESASVRNRLKAAHPHAELLPIKTVATASKSAAEV